MKHSLAEASWLNRIYVGLVHPVLHGKTYRGLGRRLGEFRRSERMSLAENKERQWRSLCRLLQHAYDSTPFYRDRFDRAGLKPSEIRSTEDLQKIPVLTREDLRLHFEALWSRRYQRESLSPAATGGTTDTPVPLLRSPECLKEKLAVKFHFDTWAGMWPGDKVLRLWGAQQDFSTNPSWRWRLYERYLLRRAWAPASLMNPAVLESYRQLLNQFRPKVIYAYPTPLALLCEFLRDCGRPYHRPASAICTAEPLLDQQRQVIGQTLGCPVFEHYGTRDFGMAAAECEEHQGLHLNPAAAYVELRPVSSTEVAGLQEMIITDLLNYGMPLIRYRINDCALLGPERCTCGRGFPLIGRIIGRTADVFQLPNGDRVPGISLHRIITEDCPGFKKIQIIQDTVTDFRVRFVRGESFRQADLEFLVKRLGERFGNGIHWGFEPVADIERERSGKTRFCISYVQSAGAMTARATAPEPEH